MKYSHHVTYTNGKGFDLTSNLDVQPSQATQIIWDHLEEIGVAPHDIQAITTIELPEEEQVRKEEK